MCEYFMFHTVLWFKIERESDKLSGKMEMGGKSEGSCTEHAIKEHAALCATSHPTKFEASDSGPLQEAGEGLGVHVHVPAMAAGDEVKQMVAGKITEQGREPQNVLVVTMPLSSRCIDYS